MKATRAHNQSQDPGRRGITGDILRNFAKHETTGEINSNDKSFLWDEL
jgi:hypothetical protein